MPVADPPRGSTTQLLTLWEEQSTASERLCADILRLEGFENVDPQSPLGGPDGGKDILCEKGGLRFVAACHFPHGKIAYACTRNKFREDLKLSLHHERDGFIFMTNQQLAPLQRAELEKEAANKKKRCLVFHREHLRVVLDSPNGYGVRLRHLNIPLSTEEQFAYFATANESTASAIGANTRAIERLTDRIERIGNAQMGLALKTTAVITRRGTCGCRDPSRLPPWRLTDCP